MKSACVVGTLLLVLVSGCGLNDSQKQGASDIASGLAGGTGKTLANGAASLTGAAPSGATSKLGQMIEGAMWLIRFKVLENPSFNLTNGPQNLINLPGGVCSSGTTSYCTGSCPTASSYKVACAFGSTAADYTCNGTTYEFTNATYSITADFTNSTGSYGSATGNFGLNIAIGGNVSGGALGGKNFTCSMNFTIDISGLKHGTVTHFSPSCDNFSCNYDGKTIGCADVQSKMAASTISCS